MQKTIVAVIIIFLVSVIIGAFFIIVFNGRGGGDNGNNEEELKRAGQTVLVSYDEGENWKDTNIFGNFDVRQIFLSKRDAGKIFAVTEGNGIYKKEKNSEKWEKLFPPAGAKNPKGTLFYYITEDYQDNVYISEYINNRGKVIKYNLKDRSEEDIFETPLQKYAVFGINSSFNGDNIKIVASDGGFYESRDSGYSWRVSRRFKEGLLSMEINSATGDFFTATSKGKILKFSPKAEDFIDLSDGLNEFDKSNIIKNLHYDLNSGFLYLASGYGILKSKNGSGIWESVTLLLPPESLPVEAVMTDPYSSNIIYAGSRNEFFKSDDGGKSWRVVTLPTTRTISSIAVDFLDPKTIYVGLK